MSWVPFFPVVTLKPQSRTAFPGTNVSFFCEGESSGNIHLSINNELNLVSGKLSNEAIEEQYRRRNFTWSMHKNMVDGVKHIRWEVYVRASIINNLTRIICFFGRAISNPAVLYVVEGKCIMLATQYLV